MLRVEIPLKSEKDVPKATQILRQVGYSGAIRGRGSMAKGISAKGSEVVSSYELIISATDETMVEKIIVALAEARLSATSRAMQVLYFEGRDIS